MSTVIAKNVQIGTSGTATDNFTIFQPATPDGTLRIGNGNTGITTSQVALTSAGNVGIGTSSPGTKLDVKGLARSSIGTGTGAGGAGYAFYQFGTSATATENWHIGSEGDGSFRFYNQGFGAGLERMRIDSSGNVGIGTSSPGTRLDVRGSIGAADAVVYVTDTSGTGASSFPCISFRDTGGQRGLAGMLGDNFHINAAPATGGILFRTNNTERARIASTGQMSTTTGTGSVMVAYDARAWVNFNGTGTVAIRASGNVTSITDNGVGDYTINFTNAMPDANYGVASCLASDTDAAALIAGTAGGGATTKTTSAVRVTSRHGNAALTDYAEMNYSIFR